jgi:hypothetical protein
MNQAVIPIPERFAMSLEGLCRAVAARIAGGAMVAWMIVAVWARIRRVERDFLALLARFQAGRLVVRKAWVRPVVANAPVTGAGHVDSAIEPRRGGADWRRLPRRFAWLLPLVPGEAANFASQIRFTLEDPAVQALLEVSPRARRILAPLCQMLGIERSVLRKAAAVAVKAPVLRTVRKRRRAPAVVERIVLSPEIMAAARKDGFGKR